MFSFIRAFRIAGHTKHSYDQWLPDDKLAAEFMGILIGTGSSVHQLGDSLCSTAAMALLRQTHLAWINSEDEKKRDPRY